MVSLPQMCFNTCHKRTDFIRVGIQFLYRRHTILRQQRVHRCHINLTVTLGQEGHEAREVPCGYFRYRWCNNYRRRYRQWRNTRNSLLVSVEVIARRCYGWFIAVTGECGICDTRTKFLRDTSVYRFNRSINRIFECYS
ncbi:hypothetical protein [Pectobacterium phage PEAT2]|uniref:Uncharacterized protein n=1 Tax=Pectobacterium phage PEAT2 TaxID=2053078 RepID=A0A2H4N7E5_9CAUD|nr:hypothetical protein F8206_gp10 [Pectobacterium phage PEAT2]ATV25109.1 hypothetical protein [Pectobacterium phage PEAT2]